VRILSSTGNDELARVFVAELDDGARIELVESVQPPRPRSDKWVLIVSTLRGCPVGCAFCDAGGHYRGRLSAEEILAQVEFLVRRRHPDGRVPARMLKVQLARMGEPALNDGVLDALEALPTRIDAPGLLPSLSTVAPWGRDRFFERLLDIKQRHYPGGRFQLQFSLHTTDEALRRRVVPIRTWGLERIAAYGTRFHAPSDRKITLNFATARGWSLDPDALLPLFSPEHFLIKLTPVNPTRSAQAAGLQPLLDPDDPARCQALADRFAEHGYHTLISIGELEENQIGSNCGMYLSAAPTPRPRRHPHPPIARSSP